MPRYHADPTKVRLFPECPSQFPPLRAWWDRQAEGLRADPRNSGFLTAAQIAAILRRRFQERWPG